MIATSGCTEKVSAGCEKVTLSAMLSLTRVEGEGRGRGAGPKGRSKEAWPEKIRRKRGNPQLLLFWEWFKF